MITKEFENVWKSKRWSDEWGTKYSNSKTPCKSYFEANGDDVAIFCGSKWIALSENLPTRDDLFWRKTKGASCCVESWIVATLTQYEFGLTRDKAETDGANDETVETEISGLQRQSIEENGENVNQW